MDTTSRPEPLPADDRDLPGDAQVPVDETPADTADTEPDDTDGGFAGPRPAPDEDAGDPSGASDDYDTATAEQVGLLRRPINISPRLTRAVRGLSPIGTAVLVGLLVVALAAPTVAFVDRLMTPRPEPVRIVAVPDDTAGIAVELYERVLPAVVTVYANGADATERTGVGSGFFIRPGVVATNLHVVSTTPSDAAALALGETVEVTVLLADGRERQGQVTGYDERLDLALVEVEDAPETPVLAFSPEVKVGTPVWAFGSPFGISNTMTGGAVTGVDVETAFRVTPLQASLIMTDAAVNPGNSGGPLVAVGEDGEPAVVGMVTLRPDESAGRSVQGITFALPAATLIDVIGQLDADGEVAWAFIGLALSANTPDDEVFPGVTVDLVTEGFGAEEAGVEVGDVLVKVGDRDVTRYTDVTAAVRAARPGDVLTLSVLRDGEQLEIDVELSERPSDQ